MRSALLIGLLLGTSCAAEVVVERYEDGATKLTREVRRDASGETVAHGTTTRYRHATTGQKIDDFEPIDLGLVAWTKEYRDGMLHGESIRYYLDGSIQELVSYRDGVKHGPSVCYHPNGTASEEGSYLDGLAHGAWRARTEDGSVLFESEFDRGTGEWAVFFDDVMTMKGRQVKDLWEGPVTRYGPMGKVLGVQQHKAGEPADGPWREWHANGRLRWEGRIENGLREGVWVYYEPTGKKCAEGKFVAGIKTGRWRYWERGGLQAEGEYVDGKADGLWMSKRTDGGKTVLMKAGALFEGLHTEFHADGSKRLECEYEYGMPSGRYALWDENGVKREEGQFDDHTGTTTHHGSDVNDEPDRVVEHRKGEKAGRWIYYDENGTRIRTGSYEAGKEAGTWFWFSGDGTITRQCGFEDGLEQGRCIERREDGTLEAAGEMHGGLRIGLWTFYDEHGGLKIEEGRFDRGKRSGHWVRYHPNGKIAEAGAYTDDRPTGRWERYDEKGTLLEAVDRRH